VIPVWQYEAPLAFQPNWEEAWTMAFEAPDLEYHPVENEQTQYPLS
jgi:hypothetical protein